MFTDGTQTENTHLQVKCVCMHVRVSWLNQENQFGRLVKDTLLFSQMMPVPQHSLYIHTHTHTLTEQQFGVFPACIVVQAVEGVVVWLNRLKQASDSLREQLRLLFHSDQSQATQGCKHSHMTQTAGLCHKVPVVVSNCLLLFRILILTFIPVAVDPTLPTMHL